MLRKPSLQCIAGIFLGLFLTGGLFINVCAQNKKVVFLKNKNNSPYSISNPETYLSSRAIQRRKKFNIAIDSSDLPINPNYIATIGSLGECTYSWKIKMDECVDYRMQRCKHHESDRKFAICKILFKYRLAN